MTDEKTILDIKNRKEAAINQVINKYSRLLWYISRKILRNIGSDEDVEECVADCFLHLWENPQSFDPQRGNLKTWLSILVRSKSYDRCREILRRNTLSIEKNLFGIGLDAADDFLKQESIDALHSAMEKLSEQEREILIRRYYYEQKPREIAAALALSVKQVDNHLYHSKRKLRDLLSQ